MKWRLIAAVVIIAVFFSEEILAKPPKYKPQSTKVTVAIDKPNKNLANRRPVSTAVTSFKPQTSRFRAVSSPKPSRPAPSAKSSLSSRFSLLRLSSASRPSVSKSGSPSTSTKTGGATTTPKERWSNIRNKPDRYQAKQPNAIKPTITGRVSISGSIVYKRSGLRALKPSLKQMYTSAKKPQSKPSPNPTPPDLNRPASPPPGQANNPVTNQPGTPVNNPEPGPVFQPPAPEALVQVAVAPAPSGSRAEVKVQKKLAKANRIVKNQANTHATLEQVNAIAGTCKDPTAPASACFDFYILSVSWGITMQIRRLGITNNVINKAEWGVHGLWPALKNYGKHPKHCNLKIPYEPKELQSALSWRPDPPYDKYHIIQDMLEDMWFSANGSPMTHQAFWRHEWEKHGTCAARSPQLKTVKQYFEKGLELFHQVDVQAKLTAANFRPKKEMTNKDMHDEISRILGHRITLESIDHPRTGELWLSEIRLCYGFNFHLIDCPPDTKTLNTMNENTKMIYSL
ncbi:hypothetical protein G9C98_000781 [Cotesia typhae]|uniref:Uncharacterized protein n=1 Tax=Cotesia typhae TaxID=2053667 RepID=A0A8J5QWX9_9HYME|nr:hypothetical protein G9C98_000781 [Cotesia typhae]